MEEGRGVERVSMGGTHFWAPLLDCKCRSHLLTHAQSLMNSCVDSFHASLNRPNTVRQDNVYAMLNPCQHLVHMFTESFSLSVAFVLLFW